MKTSSLVIPLVLAVLGSRAVAQPVYVDSDMYPKATLGKALLAALDDPSGHVKCELVGKARTVIQRIIGKDAVIFIEVKRLRDLARQDCKVLSVEFEAPGTLMKTKEGPRAFRSPPISFDYCRDGRPAGSWK